MSKWEETGPEFALNADDKAAIETQLKRLLANPHFSNSRRFPVFLRFVVQSVLQGKGDALKERTIGIEVFGRTPDYDTTSDPIVRVTAAEIRKRIAQYYQEQGHNDEVRISLEPGSYVPQFQFMRANHKAEEPRPVQSAPAELRPAPEAQAFAKAPTRRWLFALIPLALLLVAGFWFWRYSQRSALEKFWSPVLDSDGPVMFCIADQSQFSIALRDAANPAQQTILKDILNAIVIDDLTPLVHMAGLMESHHHRYHVRGEASTNLTDLRDGPTVFVGAFDNAWTLRLTNSLRYHFGNDPEMAHFWIADANSSQRWVLNRGQQEATNNYRDYGIVARFTDATTGNIAVVAAGIARGATIAAGEFLTEPTNMEALASKAPRGWERKNIEVVISTEIIDGRSAPPRMEAIYVW